MVTPALGLIKISLFLQYYALFKVVRYVKISIVLGASISAVFYITVSIVAFILTSPWPGEDFVETITTPHYLKFAEFSIPIGVIGTVLDCVLLVLPLPAIWQLHLSSKKKLGIALIFMTGGL